MIIDSSMDGGIQMDKTSVVVGSNPLRSSEFAAALTDTTNSPQCLGSLMKNGVIVRNSLYLKDVERVEISRDRSVTNDA